MTLFSSHVLSLALVVLATTNTENKWTEGAYTLYGNANIFTGTEDGISAQAMAVDIDTGTILGVGTEQDIRTTLGDEMTYFDLQNQMILPGFQDAHVHAVEAGIFAQICYIEEFADLYDVASYLQACPAGGFFGDQGWVLGAGIDLAEVYYQVYGLGYEYPVDVLDRDFPDTPVLILDNLGHGAIVNSKAIDLVGYGTIQTNPLGGIIDRDQVTGRPTGIMGENAQQIFRSAALPPTTANQELAFYSLIDALAELNADGITTVSDAGGFWRQAQTEAWKRAEDEGLLTVRASNALYVYPDTPINQQLDDLVERYSNDPSKLVQFKTAKIYVDGILTLGTSALKQPYEAYMELPPGQEYGFEYFENTLVDVTKALTNAGSALHMHSSGDRGVALALNAIEGSNPGSGPHRLTHCYLVANEDRVRFKDLDVVADFQLAASSTSAEYQRFMVDAIGQKRATEIFLPAVPLLNDGALITLSSDWDADVLSPLRKLKHVLTLSEGKAIPSLSTALKMYTLNPAILLNQDHKTGTIEVGKYADFVVMDMNLFELPYQNIDQAQIVATFLQGNVVYDPAGVFSLPSPASPAPSSPPPASSTPAPTSSPTKAPTPSKIPAPTNAPTKPPTHSPIPAPTNSPTKAPTHSPIQAPTNAPTMAVTSGICLANESIVVVEVITDNYPKETSWELRDDATQLLIAEAWDEDFPNPNTIYTSSPACVPNGQCTTLTVWDWWCDGLSNGQGGFTVYLNGQVAGSGSHFGCQTSVRLCQ